MLFHFNYLQYNLEILIYQNDITKENVTTHIFSINKNNIAYIN